MNSISFVRLSSHKKRGLILILVLTICAIGFAWLFFKTREPEYNGKPLSLWLEDYSQSSRNSKPTVEEQKAMLAMSKMGTNAIPIVLGVLKRNDSPLLNKYREKWPTFPGLVKMVLPQPKPETFTVHNAEEALRLVAGTNIWGELPQLLKARNPAVRETASACLIWSTIGKRSISDEEILALCLPCLKDPDPRVRLDAALTLERVGPAASNAVPDLIASLQLSEAGRQINHVVPSRASTAMALGSIGPAAVSSVPALTNLLPSADAYLRVQIASALWHITGDEGVALPLLISNCAALSNPVKWSAVKPLEEMGPRAKAAIPMLLAELKNTKGDTQAQSLISQALKVIDPEAVGKAGLK